MRLWRLIWAVSQHRRREFWLGLMLWVGFFTMPAVSGYLLSRGYATLSAGDTRATLWWAAAVALSELIRMLFVHAGAMVWVRVWIHMQSLLRANMLAAQLASGR